MSLQSPDPDLHELTLLDWLTINSDDRIRGFLGETNKVQEGVNAVASRNRAVKVANKERNAEIKARGAKPTKSELKRDKRTNTIAEKVAMTGVPIVPKDIAPPPASTPYRESPATHAIKPIAMHLDLAQAIRASRNK